MGYVMGAVGTAAAIAAMVPFTGLFSLAAYDEQNNWELFRLTLPLTRRQVVFGRYASIALLTVGSLALALVLGLGIAWPWRGSCRQSGCPRASRRLKTLLK